MQIFRTTIDIENKIFEYKKNNTTIAFIPTMGSLHAGHISLIDEAKKYAQKVVVSIFVNPRQFTNTEDLKKYPRDEKKDISLLENKGVDILFLPTIEEIYPQNNRNNKQDIIFLPKEFSEEEGQNRPGHFEGVYQVLDIFFSIISPDIVIFGQKDFQQIRLVQYLIQNKFPEIKCIIGKILRDKDGLALSSRNIRLSNQGKKDALIFNQTIELVQKKFSKGEKDVKTLLTMAQKKIKTIESLSKITSLCIRDKNTFELKTIAQKGDVFILAGSIEGIHLLDNTVLEV